ncbi:MAG TPA: thioredoxin domain-containing protein, partial [Anaerolinea sp.]|nr:thioredoxin domain-containing protein [Anaerolinea sp.]
MLKRVLPILAVLTILLAACQPGNTTPGLQTTAVPMEGCKVAPLLPTPDPTLVSLIPPVQTDDHVLGKDSAPVTFIEYSDYQCPYCAVLAPILPKLVEKYPDDVRIVYRYFPLSIHSNAVIAAQAVEAASLQGKFAEMEETVFANQDKWAGSTPEEATKWLLDTGASLGLDRAKLESDLTSDKVKQRVDRNLQEATKAQLPGTPFLFINGLP